LLRLLIGSIMRMLTRYNSNANNVLFLLDESAMLGQMRCLEEACTQYRKFGIKLWFFWQSLDQMKVCFGDQANVILGNMDTQQYFGLNDYETAEAISKRIGECTIFTQSENRTIGYTRPTGHVGPHNQAGSRSESTSITTTPQGRRLYKPEEILVMPQSMALVFHKNLPPIRTSQIVSYADREFTDGRTGRQRGVGVPAGLAAACTLGVGVLFASYASVMPVLPVLQRMLPLRNGGREEPSPALVNPYSRQAAYPKLANPYVSSRQRPLRGQTRRSPIDLSKMIRIP
jgi:type IV secretion system protein VirD4